MPPGYPTPASTLQVPFTDAFLGDLMEEVQAPFADAFLGDLIEEERPVWDTFLRKLHLLLQVAKLFVRQILDVQTIQL
jgi:hypothetical protein